MSNLPVPSSTLNGSTSSIAHLRTMRSDMIGWLEHLAGQGDFLRIPFGPTQLYFVNRPELVRQVLATHAAKFHKPSNVKFVARHLFGSNVFTSDGDLWRVLRRTLAPAFHTRRVHAYGDVMVRYTDEMVAGWEDGARIDVPGEMMNLTLAITTKALFDADMRAPDVEDAIIRFIALFNEAITGLPVPGYIPTRRNRELKSLVQTGRDHLQPLIDERRASGVDRGDVLSSLIEAQSADETGLLTDAQVTNEITNLFAAGYEVTAHSLAFTLYLIAQHPDVEARLLAEIDATLGERPATVTDLPQLPYLEQVLKESMRLLPVTTVIARQAAEPVEVGGVSLRKNDTVLIAPWTLQRHRNLFDAPLTFDPSRFAPDRQAEIEKFAYIPFASGPRICLGNAFAMLQMRLNLATILQRFTLSAEATTPLEPIYQFNTRPKHDMIMTAHRRAPISNASRSYNHAP